MDFNFKDAEEEHARLSKIASTLGLNTGPKSFVECRMAFYDTRLSEYLREHKDLQFQIAGWYIRQANAFIQKDGGKFDDYLFLAEHALKYVRDYQYLYTFALKHALDISTTLEQSFQTKKCFELGKELWAEKRPMGMFDAQARCKRRGEEWGFGKKYYSFRERARIWLCEATGARMWQTENLRTCWGEMGKELDDRINKLERQLG
jgi:hypothetical protein